MEGATLCGEELLLESAKIAREIEMIEDIKNISIFDIDDWSTRPVGRRT